MSIEIGDKVKVVHEFHIWLTNYNLPRETILTVVEDDDTYNSYVNCDDKTIEISAIKTWSNDFEKVEDKFFAGCNPPQSNQVAGDFKLNQPTVLAGLGRGFHLGAVSNDPVAPTWIVGTDGQLTVNAKIVDEETVAPSELGVYRPNLEDRKVGKVGMHMVIDGFPRALREVAKVMTWAADAKGYKLHDWRNLPNADVAFPSAEYRHQNDNSIMKSEGTPAIERTDHESNLLHAAHKIFNGLAELELILTGVIK